jgi:hypothetical protein
MNWPMIITKGIPLRGNANVNPVSSGIPTFIGIQELNNLPEAVALTSSSVIRPPSEVSVALQEINARNARSIRKINKKGEYITMLDALLLDPYYSRLTNFEVYQIILNIQGNPESSRNDLAFTEDLRDLIILRQQIVFDQYREQRRVEMEAERERRALRYNMRHQMGRMTNQVGRTMRSARNRLSSGVRGLSSSVRGVLSRATRRTNRGRANTRTRSRSPGGRSR